jgi:broad specificity phosphatase PhoE
MKLIITRHGETIENKRRIIQGHLPGRLSRLGKTQAKLLAKRLSSVKIDAIYSSDLARAHDTAREIAKHHPGVRVRGTRLLREFHCGSWTGKRVPPHVHGTQLPPDAESRPDACARVKLLLDQVQRKHDKETVLFVAHGGINRALITVINERDPDHIFKLPLSGNTAVTIIRIEKGKKARVLTRDCTKHLKAGP